MECNKCKNVNFNISDLEDNKLALTCKRCGDTKIYQEVKKNK